MKKSLYRRRKQSGKDDAKLFTGAAHAVEGELKTVADALDHLNRNGPLVIGDILLVSGSSLAPSNLFSSSSDSE